MARSTTRAKSPKANGVANGKQPPAKATEPTPPVAQTAAATRPAPHPLEAVRTRLQADLGQVILSMLDVPRYRSLGIGELKALVVEPLSRERISIARARHGDGTDTLVGVAIWASVSAAVDARIRDQIKAGVFPVRLGPEDWTSGDQYWLLDVIAASREQATQVLISFEQVTGGKPVHVHPSVSRGVDQAVLQKLKGAAARPSSQPE